MSTKTIHTCAAPDGTAFKRTSSSGRVYKFAVVGKGKNGKWLALSWHSRRDLALRAKDQVGSWYSETYVTSVEAVEKAVKEKPAADYPADTFTAEGITFAKDPTGYYSRIGEYRGWTVVLHSTGKSFRASAFAKTDDWQRRAYSDAAGKLDTRVKDIKAKIDAEIEKA